MNKVLEYIIRAKDATKSGLDSAATKVKNFASSIGKNLANIQAGFQMLRQAVSAAASFMSKAFQFEKMTVQFKTLMGSMDEAREHMKMLQDMGDTPPFSLEQFAAASRQLMIMTDGALGLRNSLELVGDAAAATGQSIDSLAHHVGLAFASIRDGAPISRATFALRSMGAITPEVAEKLDQMQKSGAGVAEIWQTLEDALGKFKGAMEETEQTGDGLVAAIQSQWDDAVREFGEALLETSKDGLGAVLDKMKELREDGSIAVWAEKVKDAMGTVGEAIGYVSSLFSGLWKLVKSTIGVAMAFGAGADAEYAAGGGLIDQIKAGAAAAKQMWKDTWNPQEDPNEKEHDQAVRDQAVERQAEKEEKRRKKSEEEEARKQQRLAESQKKLDERRAAELAAKEEEEYRKATEKAIELEEKSRLEMERAIARERERLWKESLKEYTKAYEDATKEESDAQSRLAEAQARERQAWGWYRDKDSLRAQLDEEKANAEAEARFEKEFDSLRRRRSDWRTAAAFGSGGMRELSLDEEAVRRVALAREEQAAAEQYAKETAEATARAAEALEAIQEAIEEGGEG